MPLPDTFTGTNSTPLAAYDPLWVKHPAYTTSTEIFNNKARHDGDGPAGTSLHYYNTVQLRDMTVQAILNQSSATANNAGIAGRMSASEDDYYLAKIQGANIRLEKYLDGVETLLGSAASGLVNGVDSLLTLTMRGSTITVHIDNVLKISVTDTDIPGPGFAGVRFFSANISLDNFNFYGATSFALPQTTSGFGRMGARVF